MSNSQLVSVVIATRDRLEMLKTALEAVRNQTYAGPIECLVVFDQMEPDHSVASEDPHRRVIVLANTERTPGLAGARNTGILAASGDYVAFCDDDDVWLPQKLKRQMDSLGEALTSVTGITIDYKGRQVERIPRQKSFTLENVVRKRLMEGHPSSVLMQREAILGPIGLVDEGLPQSYAEDFDFILRAMQAGAVSVVEEPLVTVRWGQSMFSRNWGIIVQAVDYLIDKHPIIARDRRAVSRLYARRGFANASQGNRGEALHDMARTLRNWPFEKRILATIPVLLGIVPGHKVLDFAHKYGRGI